MTNEELKQQLDRLADPVRKATLSDACSALWPRPVQWDAEKMELLLAFATTDQMGNPLGWLHGGVMATIFDNSMGWLANSYAQGYFTPTISMDLNYLRPVPMVGTVYVRTRILKLGRSFIHTTAELAAEPEFKKTCAAATAVYAIHKEAKI